TLQFGSWAAQAIPAILPIQNTPAVFRNVVAELVARLRRPFILFAPTSDYLIAECLELLANLMAAFFAIDSTLTLTPQASLSPRIKPDELLACFEERSLQERSLQERSIQAAEGFDNSCSVIAALPPAALPRCSVNAALRPRYALRKGLGVWPLDFDGGEAD